MFRRWVPLALAALCLPLWMGACADGPTGEDGDVKMHVRVDSTVTQVTLTGIGVGVDGTVPDPNVQYSRRTVNGRVDWRSGGQDYTAHLEVKAYSGDKGDEGVLPAGTLGCNCPPLVQKYGEPGDDRYVTLLFKGDRLLVFSGATTIEGSP